MMSVQMWRLTTRIWFFNTVGWAFITLTFPMTSTVFVTLGCLALTLWSNRRYHDANEGGATRRSSEDQR